MKTKLFILFLLLLTLNSASIAQRKMISIEVPGAKCGDGSDYQILFSAGPDTINGNPNNRLVIWFPGGGSTMNNRNGELSTAINSTYEITDRLTIKNDLKLFLSDAYMNGDRNFIFANHPDNDEFVKDAHWAIFPYCTQDFHSGNLNEEIIYDFTGEKKLVAELDSAINGLGYTLDEIYSRFPSMNIEGEDDNGKFKINKVEIGILHHGAKNVELAFRVLLNELKNNRNFDITKADVLISGSSAGGFGTWYNAWRIGDKLYKYNDTRLTVVPQSGSPYIKVWNEDERDLVINDAQIESINHRLAWHNVSLPCEKSGANYNGGDNCKDALDLLDHYLNRWEGMDVNFLAVVNKEDLIATSNLNDEELLNFCKTVHRYAQYFYLTPNTYPYAAWLFRKMGPRDIRRVHGFKGAALTVDMLEPNGENKGFGLLEYINMVATRNVIGAIHIEHTPGIIQEPDNYDSDIEPVQNHLPGCNVEWPVLSADDPDKSNNKTLVYPNPFSNFTTIEFHNPDNRIYTFKLYNILGEIVLIKNNILGNKVLVKRSNLTTGVYLFQLSSRGQIRALGKLIIK